MNDRQHSLVRKFVVGSAASAAEAAGAAGYAMPMVNDPWTFPRGTMTVVNVRRHLTWPRLLRRLEILWRRLTGDYRWVVEIEYRLPAREETPQ